MLMMKMLKLFSKKFYINKNEYHELVKLMNKYLTRESDRKVFRLDYDKENKLGQKEKDNILKPFKFNGKNNYCIIIELKTTNSSTLDNKVSKTSSRRNSSSPSSLATTTKRTTKKTLSTTTTSRRRLLN